MSFAYIDSKGKEVQIPSADALRLRIELGAIRDATDFYDAAQDRWAPAGDHEIYRTLKREVDEASAGGFVAPPPSALEASAPPVDTTPSVDPTPPAEPAPPEEPEPSPEPEFEFEGPLGSDDFDSDDFGFDTELTLSDSFDAVPPADDPFDEALPELGSGTGDGDDFDFGGEELTLADTSDVERPREDSDPEPFASADLEAPHEDGPGEGIELDDSVLGPEDAESPPRWDVSADLADTVVPEPDDDGPAFGMAFEGGDPDDTFEPEPATVDEEPLEIESSDMSSYDPAAAPSWIEEEAGPDETFAAASAGAEEEERRDPYQRNIRRTSAPPPRREVTPKGSGAGRFAAIAAVVVVLAAGGYLATQLGGGSEREGVEEVVLPELPADLQPQLRALAQRASRRMVEAFDSLPARLALPESPGVQWLSGAYLAEVSRFGGIEAYWRDFGVLLERMIAEEDPLWRGFFEEEIVLANMTADNAAAVRDRGLAGWEASSTDRDIVYDQLRRVIETSLDLHAFLQANESEIEYTPAAAGRDRDPVLEAVPATEELGEEMWARVGEITNALDALGYLQQVETEPLFGVVKEKLVATGIR
jgi:hypothetical protein